MDQFNFHKQLEYQTSTQLAIYLLIPARLSRCHIVKLLSQNDGYCGYPYQSLCKFNFIYNDMACSSLYGACRKSLALTL